MKKHKGVRFAIGFVLAAFFVQGLCLCRADVQAAGHGRSPYVAAILMEPKTGQILYEQEIQKPWPSASLTKMMVMLLVGEMLERKAISLSDPVKVSARASKIGGSQVYLKDGEVFTLEEMMKALVIHSANDAAAAVAEKIAGSTEAFVRLMNQRAEELGLKQTKYYTVHGLPPRRGQHPDMTSAYDTAVLARELVRYPEILKWSSTVREGFRDGEFILENRNQLVGKFPGVDGLKTGFYFRAGFNVAATAEQNGMRVIAVILGSPSDRIRFREGARLLKMGLHNYTMLTVMKAGEAVSQEIRVKGGKISVLHAVLGTPAEVVVMRSAENQLKSSIHLKNPVWAPLRKGDRLGELDVRLDGKTLGKFPLISNQDVEQSNILKRLLDSVF